MGWASPAITPSQAIGMHSHKLAALYPHGQPVRENVTILDVQRLVWDQQWQANLNKSRYAIHPGAAGRKTSSNVKKPPRNNKADVHPPWTLTGDLALFRTVPLRCRSNGTRVVFKGSQAAGLHP